MIVLGIDQGMGKAAGYAVANIHKLIKPSIIYTYLETYKYLGESNNGQGAKEKSIPVEDLQWRYKRFFNTTQRIIVAYKPDLIVTELPFHFSGHYDTTLRVISELNGILILMKPDDTPIIRINVASWQKEMGLKNYPGKNTKEQSVALIQDLFGETFPDHITDALCLTMAAPAFLAEENRNIALLSR